jgi:hypothetical protein
MIFEIFYIYIYYIMNFRSVENDLTYNKKRSYNVVLNSAAESETNKGDITYNFDWSILPENTAFEVYFTLISNVVSVSTSGSTPVPCVYAELGQSNTFEASTLGVRANNTQYLGSLCLNGIGSNTFFRTDETMNPPIYLHRRPNNNIFKVQMYLQSDTPGVDAQPPTIWSFSTATMPNYVLTLKFVPVD